MYFVPTDNVLITSIAILLILVITCILFMLLCMLLCLHKDNRAEKWIVNVHEGDCNS